ncbi:MAG: type II toxin-antitoxin system VapC family toxin [Mycolicibacterium sp.]|uniref:type II toxin-antitoxin system VapC family toxin n=1 Tax=Mycolicibacterium sp. TaxID=2320850 RepID=UPI003D10573F
MNVLLYAFRRDSADHLQYAQWLQSAMTGPEPVGISELVLSGVMRLATNFRVYRQPSSTAEVLDYCAAVRSAPAAMPLRPGDRHWEIFSRLCRSVSATANDIPDAYHAALAVENGATWITNDRGYARYPDLQWRSPLDPN